MAFACSVACSVVRGGMRPSFLKPIAAQSRRLPNCISARWQPKAGFHSSSGSGIQPLSVRGRINLFRCKLPLGVITITGLGLICLFQNDCLKEGKIQKHVVNFATAHHLRMPLLFISEKVLVDDLFTSVRQGDFAKAQFLINRGSIDVNVERRCCDDVESEVLLEAFLPTDTENLDQFIDFAIFVISRGYKHLNRPKGGKEGEDSLLTQIYNRHSYNKPQLRRKLLTFFLMKGVNPFYKNKHMGLPLSYASFYGDGEFFIKVCRHLNISLNLEKMNEEDSFEVLYYAATGIGPIDDLKFLLESGIKVGPNKSRLLKAIKRNSFECAPQKLKQVEELIKGAAT